MDLVHQSSKTFPGDEFVTSWIKNIWDRILHLFSVQISQIVLYTPKCRILLDMLYMYVGTFLAVCLFVFFRIFSSISTVDIFSVRLLFKSVIQSVEMYF